MSDVLLIESLIVYIKKSFLRSINFSVRILCARNFMGDSHRKFYIKTMSKSWPKEASSRREDHYWWKRWIIWRYMSCFLVVIAVIPREWDVSWNKIEELQGDSWVTSSHASGMWVETNSGGSVYLVGSSHPTRVGCELKRPHKYVCVPDSSHPTRVGCELKHKKHRQIYWFQRHPTRVGCEVKRKCSLGFQSVNESSHASGMWVET